MIGVIGATGNVGRALVQMLAEAGEEVVAVSRRGGHDAKRVRHATADLGRPQQLTDALRGAKAVFLMVAGSGAGLDADAIVGALKNAGTERVVLLSSIGTRSRPNAVSHEPLRRFEAAVEGGLSSSTILRPSGFFSNAMAWIPDVRARRVVAAPFGETGIPLVHPDDIAAVAAAALRDDRHAASVYDLTGPKTLTPREQTAILEAAIGAPLRFVELTRAQAAEAWRVFMPPAIVETTLDALGTPNECERRLSPDVERVLGRPAQAFAAWAARNADLFR